MGNSKGKMIFRKLEIQVYSKMRQVATEYHLMGSEPGQLALLFLTILMTLSEAAPRSF